MSFSPPAASRGNRWFVALFFGSRGRFRRSCSGASLTRRRREQREGIRSEQTAGDGEMQRGLEGCEPPEEVGIRFSCSQSLSPCRSLHNDLQPLPRRRRRRSSRQSFLFCILEPRFLILLDSIIKSSSLIFNATVFILRLLVVLTPCPQFSPDSSAGNVSGQLS